jgi:hypothetical protein
MELTERPHLIIASRVEKSNKLRSGWSRIGRAGTQEKAKLRPTTNAE